jgi:hypothetical protein
VEKVEVLNNNPIVFAYISVIIDYHRGSVTRVISYTYVHVPTYFQLHSLRNCSTRLVLAVDSTHHARYTRMSINVVHEGIIKGEYLYHTADYAPTMYVAHMIWISN